MKPLQYGFSAAYEDAAFSREGRERKANKVLAILEDAVGDLSDKHLLDIGCSAGIMTHCYARKFGRVIGTDIDMPAVAFAAGVDEAGRGPLAGAVYAAAVILNPDKPIPGLKDSKKLSV